MRIIRTIQYQNPRQKYNQYTHLQMCVSIVTIFGLKYNTCYHPFFIAHHSNNTIPKSQGKLQTICTFANVRIDCGIFFFTCACRSPSRSHSNTTLSSMHLSLSQSLSFKHTHILSLSISLCLSPSRSHHTHFVSVYFSLSQSLSFTHPHTFPLCISLCRSPSLSHTHTFPACITLLHVHALPRHLQEFWIAHLWRHPNLSHADLSDSSADLRIVTLQCVTVSCSMWQRFAVWCSAMQWVAMDVKCSDLRVVMFLSAAMPIKILK